ncbi:adenylate kinase [Arthrobacter ruber]|uniref:adenylate kinase n=1 Tax=Arthrobacter ruber TaxID=1258893 RepID=UPI000CF4512E|nr:adenylate kinase [Arthrobacter ruber]
MLIIGPPGAGKGTQAARIAERFGIPPISTGDIFRDNARRQTSLGMKAKAFLDSGDFVPDSVTNSMVRDRLAQRDVGNGFLLDGYPRTAAQVQELDDILRTNDVELNVVVQLTADEEELVRRLLRRADTDGRSDDTEAVIRHRLRIYREQTEAVVSLYDQRGIVTRINGVGTIDQVTERALMNFSHSY